MHNKILEIRDKKGRFLIKRRIINIGDKFGSLTIIKSYIDNKKCNKVICKCLCGKITCTNAINLFHKTMPTRSCGCITKVKTHEMSKSRFYNIWGNLKTRCYNKRHITYKQYGAKGVTICNKWLKFENFRKDMYKSYLNHVKEFGKKNTTIDRIDNNKGYCKENCRWATMKTQTNNTSRNNILNYKNKKKTLSEWANQYNLKPTLLRQRIYRDKWSIEKALLTPNK